jgi:hypothetical protein
MNPPIGVHDADTLTRVPGTLASRLADADEDRFVGRRSELAFFDRLLDGEGDVAGTRRPWEPPTPQNAIGIRSRKNPPVGPGRSSPRANGGDEGGWARGGAVVC